MPENPIMKQLNSEITRPMASRMIGKIRISGPIMPAAGRGYPGARNVSPDRIIQKIRWAEQRGLKALILEINSPGGAVVASKEIADAVKAAKPATVAWIRDVGASGAYWVASACDRIVADECSSVGSIGVLGQHLEFSELMKKYGVHYEGFKSGELKDMGVPFRKTTVKEKKIIQTHLDDVHRFFIKSVAENRGLPVEKIEACATGQVFMGEEARRLGLVDKIGGRAEAIRQCEIAAHFKHLTVIDIEDIRDELFYMFRTLLSQMNMDLGVGLAEGFSQFFTRPGGGTGTMV